MCCFLLLVGLSLRAGSQPPSMGQYLEGLGYRAIRTKPVRWWGGSRADGRLEGKRVEFYCFPGAAYSLVDPSLTNRLKRVGELGVTLRGSYLGDLAGDNALVAEHLALGGAEFYNQPLRAGRPSPELRDGGVRVILGNDFLLRYHAVVEFESLRLGDVPVSPFSAVVTSLKQMRPMVAQVDESVDGTLAAQALVRHAGVLDCGQRKLWLIQRTR